MCTVDNLNRHNIVIFRGIIVITRFMVCEGFENFRTVN